MEAWYAVHCHPRGEDKAAFHLRQQGYEVYLPRYQKRRRHARKVDWVAAPLFPRYLFVAFDITRNRWWPINSTVGVSHIVCTDRLPMEVPHQVITEIRNREDVQGLVNLTSTCAFRPGDKVQVRSGPFDEHIGMFENIDDKHRVTLLLDLMGRQVRVRVNANLLDRAN